MTTQPILLDLFCGAGGAAMGYHNAGFKNIVGVDLHPQPNYPFEFVQCAAITYLKEHGHKFDFIHASPPCQKFTALQNVWHNVLEHPDLVTPIRVELKASNRIWVIENVVGAPLLSPIMLCGAMFKLGTYRHRIFESNIFLSAPVEPKHVIKQTKLGRPPVLGEMMQVVGHFSGVAQGRQAMGIDWMTRDELSQSIPPAFTHYIGQQILQKLSS